VILVSKTIDAKKKTLLCVNASLEKKATNLVVMNVSEISFFADYFVICSGASDRQVQAIASAVQEKMKKNGLLPMGVEGEKNGLWVLMDYDDVIVHIFYEPVREFYGIEKLWSEAAKVEIDGSAVRLTTLGKGI
jgi:ribosome-associated protein